MLPRPSCGLRGRCLANTLYGHTSHRVKCVAGDPEPRTIRVVVGGCGVSREYARGNPDYGMWFEEGGNGWGLGWWWSLLQDFYNERKVRKSGADISDVCATRGWENIDFEEREEIGGRGGVRKSGTGISMQLWETPAPKKKA